MGSKYLPSSRNNPCPICDRGDPASGKDDGDCRILEHGNVVLCHTCQDKSPDINGYRFVRTSDKGAGWGVWIWVKQSDNGKVVGKKIRPKFEKRQYFDYPDRGGNPLIRVVRQKGAQVEFYQEYWIDGQWLSASKVNDELKSKMRAAVPIYRYHEVRAAVERGDVVLFCEGESAANALWDAGIAATTTIGGSKAYRNWGSYKQDLQDASLVLCPDRDKEGVAYIDEVAKDFPTHSLYKVFKNSPVWEFLPDAGGLDVVDELEAGATKETVLNGIIKPESQDKSETAKGVPSYNEALDWVDALEQQFSSEGELEWAVLSYIKESGLSAIGIRSHQLIKMARSRRDGQEAIEDIDAIDILESNEDGRAWIIPGLLPLGSAICFAAGGGTGKTTLVYNLAKHIALGRAWSGYPVKQGKVLIIQTDEPTVDIRDKLDIANYFEVPRGLIRFVTKWRFSQIRQLEALISKHEPSLIIIDSYTAAHAGMDTELSKSSAGDSLYRLRDIANAKGCSFIVIHHLNKMDGLRDSSTIKDNVSEVWMMTKDEQQCSGDHQLVLEISKSRAGIAGQYLMERNPVDYSWTHLGRVDGHQTHLKRVVGELKKLAPRTFSAKQLAERINLDRREVEESLELGRRMGLLEGKWAQFTRANGSPDRFRVYGYSLATTENGSTSEPAIEAQLPERESVDAYMF